MTISPDFPILILGNIKDVMYPKVDPLGQRNTATVRRAGKWGARVEAPFLSPCPCAIKVTLCQAASALFDVEKKKEGSDVRRYPIGFAR